MRRWIWRQFCPQVLLLLGTMVLFWAVVSLYQTVVPEALVYAAGLCLLLHLLVWAVQAAGIVKDHRQRQHLLSSAAWDWGKLPTPQSLAQQDDRELIEALAAQVRSLTDQLQNQRRESLDYYTTWVHQIKTPIAALHMLLEEHEIHSQYSQLNTISQI